MPTPTTYYTPCAPIIVGCKLYLDSGFATYAPAGYYSNGFSVYQVTGFLGVVTNITNCPATTTQAPCAGGNCCFVGNTMISLADGNIKSIKNIQPGDVVLSFNEQLNEVQSSKVVNVKGRITDDLVRYTFSNGVELESTTDHPYYVNGFKIASFDPISTTDKYNFEINIDLISVGDVVNLLDGTTTVIEDIEVLGSSEKVFTFEVENNHNYYANGILVHNKTFPTICCEDVNGIKQHVSQPDCCCLGAGWAPCLQP